MAESILQRINKSGGDTRLKEALQLVFRRFISRKGDELGRIIFQSERFLPRPGTPTSLATAGAALYTIAQILTQIIVRDCAGAGRTDTLPTAALIVAGVPGLGVGDHISFTVINGSDAAESITLLEGAGGTWDANFLAAKTVVQDAQRRVTLVITNVTAGAEAYVIY